jgi:hypothetical protein
MRLPTRGFGPSPLGSGDFFRCDLEEEGNGFSLASAGISRCTPVQDTRIPNVYQGFGSAILGGFRAPAI